MSRAQEFNQLARRAKTLNKKRIELDRQSRNLSNQIEALEAQALTLVEEEIGWEAEDLVQDEFGQVYRITALFANNLRWKYQGDLVTTLKAATDRFILKGVALYSNGLPRWKEARTLFGEFTDYTPSTDDK